GVTVVTCRNARACYAAGDDGWFLSTHDGGSTWQHTGRFLPKNSFPSITGMSCPNATTCVIDGSGTDGIAVWGDIYRTSDAGKSWKHVKRYLGERLLGVHCAG